MTDVLAAEWLKIRTVRSTQYILTVAVTGVLLSGLVALGWAHSWDTTPPGNRENFRGMTVEQSLLPFVQLYLAVLGVLAITSEYATGMIRTTLAIVPARRTVLAAKAVVVAAIALVAGVVSVFAMHLLSGAVIGDRPMSGYTAPLADRIPLLLSHGLSVMVVALVGLGLGTVTRSTAGALSAVAALLFFLPPLPRLLPDPWDDRLSAVMLPALADQLADAVPRGDALLSPPAALAVMAAYVGAALAAASLAITRRDA